MVLKQEQKNVIMVIKLGVLLVVSWILVILAMELLGLNQTVLLYVEIILKQDLKNVIMVKKQDVHLVLLKLVIFVLEVLVVNQIA
jgi:hypothetical protein